MYKRIFQLVFLISFNLNAQSTFVKVIDSISNDPVPFANIYFSNNKGLITDSNGKFKLIKSEFKNHDSLSISLLGYKTKTYLLKEFKDSIIYLRPGPIQLDNIVLNNDKLNADEIIQMVINNFEINYQADITKNKIFLSRQSIGSIGKFNIDKFKSSIQEISKPLLDSIIDNLPKEYFNKLETLSYYFGNNEEGNQKINLIKARQTATTENELLESLNQKIIEAVNKNIKKDSYFKIRSGIFGENFDIEGLEKVDSTNVESIKKFELKEMKKKKNFVSSQRNRIKNLYDDLPTNSYRLDFLLKPRKYIFNEPKVEYLGDQLVYIITCYPKGNSKFSGTLYINSEDFAIIRLDFENIKPIKKWKLLGISLNQYLSKGQILLSKFEDDKYNLSYFQLTFGQRVGINRSIKLIEKNKNVKGRRKQNQISFKLDIDMNFVNKTELKVFESTKIELINFEKIKENKNVLPKYIEEFTNNFWEEF